jgi:transcriptional regulator with XRE-family HTH domain
MTGALPDGSDAGRAGLGPRLRTARARQKMTLRDLARQIGISPSLISQIETGKVQPSVKTLYAMTTALGVSLDAMFTADRASALPMANSVAPEPETAGRASRSAHVVRAGSGRVLELESGVRWEHLESWSDIGIEIRRTRYQPGSTSSTDGTFVRHSGREFGMVIDGVLTISVGFDEFVLGPGDAISFDSTIPHLLRNDGTAPAHAIWFEVDRHTRVE